MALLHSRLIGPTGLVIGLGLLSACAGRDPALQIAAEAQACYDEALGAVQARDYDEAIRQLDMAVDIRPDFGDAYLLRAKCRMKRIDQRGGERYLEESEQAVEDLKHAVRLLPWLFEAYYHRAVAYASLARYKEAAYDLLHHCLKIQPNHREANLMLAKIYDQGFEGREPEAAKYYERYIQLGGADPKIRTRYEQLKIYLTAAKKADDDETKALELFKAAMQASDQGRRTDALQMLTELSTKYAKTAFVKEREKLIAQLIQQFSPGEKK